MTFSRRARPARRPEGPHEDRLRPNIHDFRCCNRKRCAHGAIVANASVALGTPFRSGDRGPNNSSTPGNRRPCVGPSISATISASRGKPSVRPRLRAGAVSTSLPLRNPLCEPHEQADHDHEQRPDHRIHHPRETVPGTARFHPKAQFFLQDGKALGRVGGRSFHVF